MRLYIIILLLLTFSNAHAQTLGGNSVFNFLKLPYATALTAAGGVNISHASTDVSVALNNPAFLNSALHTQVGLNFTGLVADVKGYQFASAYFDEKLNTTFGAQVVFVNYGQIQAADAAGNLLGQFRANDYSVQVSAGRPYLEKWHYGASLKFLYSSYQPYQSSAIAVDVGINYFDSTKGISLSALAKNMGTQLKTYAGENEDLPFDLEFGLTKKLAHAPFAFSLTLQQVHRFNLLYNDTSFSSETNTSTSTSFLNKAKTRLFICKITIFPERAI